MNLVARKQQEVITDILTLVRETRAVLHQPGAIARISQRGMATKTHLYDYRNGKGVCFWIINDIANFAGIEYSVGNFDANDIPQDEWKSAPQLKSKN